MGVILGVFGGRWVTGAGLLVMVPPGPEMDVRMTWSPCLVRSAGPEGRVDLKLGHPLVDDLLAFADARCRPNTVLAAGFDLKVFFTIIAKDPVEVTATDVLEFIRAQRSAGDSKVVRLLDGESGLSSRTIQRRLSLLSSFYSFLVVRGDVDRNPVPRGLSTRRARDRGGRGVPLIRTPRTLPRIAEPVEIDALLGACRRFRDQAMFEAMVFGGLRRCEVLGLRLGDLDGARRQVFIVEGKGGHQRQIPISGRWFATVSDYLRHERPTKTDTERVFVVLKGQRRGRPIPRRSRAGRPMTAAERTTIEFPAPFADTYAGPGTPTLRKHDWHQIAESAPIMAATMLRYLDQIALSLRPASVTAAEGILRGFGGWITANHAEVVGLVDVERRHIEAYKIYLPTRPGKNGVPPLSGNTIRTKLGTMRTFFERTSD